MEHFGGNAIVLRQPGAAEVLKLENIDAAVAGPGQVLIRQEAAGVNFHDIYVRSGAYQTLPLPGIPISTMFFFIHVLL